MMLLEWPVGAKSRGTQSTNCPSSFLAPPSSLVLVLLLLLLGPCSDSGVVRILQGVASSSLPCHDWKNQLVRDGDEFIPDKNDPCRVCLCNDGVHTTCNMRACSPTACYRMEEVKNTCCEFRCLNAGLDNIHHNKTGDKNAIGNVKRRSDDIADQGLRLAASTVTSFLVLALLLFMVHRLCQRRHLIQMRRLNAPRNHHDDDNDNNPFSQDAFSIGMPCPPPYDCPPPPYTPPKPFAYIQPCEAPPPYEEVQNQMASNNPAFSGSLSPTSRVTDPSDCNSVQEPGSVSSMPGLGLGGIAPDNQINSIDMEDNSSIHETTPKTPFGADEGQFTHSPTMTRPFSTFFGSCTVNENSNGNDRVVRNSCGSIAARAERIRSCLFPSGKDHQDGVALGLTSQQAMAALSLRETGEETLPSKTEMFAPWYIKRSESIEIRRESRSPRNSYCFRNNYAPSDSSESESETEMPDMSSSWLKGSSNSTSMGLTATSPQSHTHPAGSNLSSFKPNNSRVANPQSSDCCNNRDPRCTSDNSGNSFAHGGIKPQKADGPKQATPGRPVRISYVDSCKSSLYNNNNTPTATTPTGAPPRCHTGSPDNNGREHSETSGISKFDSANQLANTSFVQSQEFGMNPLTLRIRNSLPPLELKALQPETRKMETLTRSSAITPPSALALSIVAGASAGGLLSVEHADDSHSERNFWNFHHPANLLNGRLQSPGTPVSSGSSPSRISIGMLHDRSNSLTSDISLFSICSETGEKKRTKEISSSCNSTSTIATTPTATTPTDICNNINNNNNNNRNNNNLNNNLNNGPPIKNDVPYPDLFQANSNSSNGSNGGSGGVGGTIGGGGAGGGGTNSSNQVAADANQMPLPRRETMTTATLVSNILKRYSDVPRQSMEHDENSYCKPSSSSTSSSTSSSSSSNTVSLVTNQQQQQQQQQHQQHPQPQANHLHTQSQQQQQQQPQANHLHTQSQQQQQQQPQANHLHTQSQQQQQQQPQAHHLHTQNQQQQQHSQQHLPQKQEQHHNNNNNNNSHSNHHHNKTSSSNNNNSGHHSNNNSSHYYHHHHHRSNRNTDSGPASIIGNSGSNTGGGGGGGAMGGDCAFAQPYPRKSEIRTLDHRSRNAKSIDEVIRTIDITPVLQSIAKPLDNTARDGSSREDVGANKSRFSALECGAGKHFLSSGFPFGDKPPPPPPPPLPMFPKPKSNQADRKKRHSVALNGGNVSKQSKTKSSTAAKAVAGKFQDDVGNSSSSGIKINSSGAAILENMKEPISSTGSSSKSESSPNRSGKSRSGSNGSGSNGSGNSTNSAHRTACEPCFKLYGYVDDPSVLYNCCHRMETDKDADRYKNAPIDKNTPNNISPAMMKYLTSSPKSSDHGHASYTAVEGAASCVGGATNSGSNSHSNTYRPKKQSQLRTSPEHKSKSSSSAAYKVSAGAVGNYATLNSHSHPSQNPNPQKKRHSRSKDKNRKSYPGASPEGAPRGSYTGASPEGAPRETKIVSNPWLTTSSSGASASSASPARRKFEKTHRSKHHNSVILDMSRTYTDDCQSSQSGAGRHANQVLNHVDQLSSYV